MRRWDLWRHRGLKRVSFSVSRILSDILWCSRLMGKEFELKGTILDGKNLRYLWEWEMVMWYIKPIKFDVRSDRSVVVTNHSTTMCKRVNYVHRSCSYGWPRLIGIGYTSTCWEQKPPIVIRYLVKLQSIPLDVGVWEYCFRFDCTYVYTQLVCNHSSVFVESILHTSKFLKVDGPRENPKDSSSELHLFCCKVSVLR